MVPLSRAWCTKPSCLCPGLMHRGSHPACLTSITFRHKSYDWRSSISQRTSEISNSFRILPMPAHIVSCFVSDWWSCRTWGHGRPPGTAIDSAVSAVNFSFGLVLIFSQSCLSSDIFRTRSSLLAAGHQSTRFVAWLHLPSWCDAPQAWGSEVFHKGRMLWVLDLLWLFNRSV